MVKKTVSQNRKSAERRGRLAEYYALIYLMIKGYRFQGLRVKTAFGELDLIMRKKNTLVFIEVKTRKRQTMPSEILSDKQKNRIIKAASYWLSHQTHLTDYSLRFDFIFISASLHITHFINAFQTENNL